MGSLSLAQHPRLPGNLARKMDAKLPLTANGNYPINVRDRPRLPSVYFQDTWFVKWM